MNFLKLPACLLTSCFIIQACSYLPLNSKRSPVVIKTTQFDAVSFTSKEILYSTLTSYSSVDNSQYQTLSTTLQTQSRLPLKNLLDRPKPIITQPGLWHQVVKEFSLPTHLDQKRVQQTLAWYRKHPSYMKRVTERARPYLHAIVEEIQKRQLPLELVLLPIVESAYDPFAYSHGRAAGLWQFIPITGQRFGLQQNWWQDQRRDILKSTNAALDYLTLLNKQFNGDWLLTLSAYNAGGGTVRRAIAKNKRKHKATDFWHLPLPKETRGYAPKWLALAELFKQHEAYNMPLAHIDSTPYLASVSIDHQIDLAQAARLAELPIDTLYQLNPGLNRWATPPNQTYQLILPTGNHSLFQQAFAKFPKDQLLTWHRHKVKPGDSLIKLAKQFQTDIRSIQTSNRLKGTHIRVGQALLIPVASKDKQHYVLSQTQRLANKQSRTSKKMGNYQVYTVKAGDSLWKIAKTFGATPKQVAKWNGMAVRDPIVVGSRLKLFSKTKITQSTTRDNHIKKIRYVIRKGDSLSRIADKFKLAVADIQKWNHSVKQTLYPGQQLTLFVDITR